MPVFSKGCRFHDSSISSHRAWTVIRKVGEGQSAEVYSVRCDETPSTQFAVKIEREPGIRTLRAELKVLKQLQDSPHACQLVEHGICQGHDYIVMELLGNNAVELRKLQAPQGRWGTHTVKQMGLPMLAALQEMHVKGLIHRDVKPANFGVSPPGYTMSSGENFEGTLKVIDFGLSKRYTDDHGRVIPKREGRAGFRGSTAYASIYAHEELEQGRRDDLWSWLYVLVEMLDGGLCWRIGKDKADRRVEDASRHHSKHMDAEKQKKKEIALKRKRAALTDPDLLTANVVLPDALKVISSYLSTLDFADEPDYDRLRADLTSMPDAYPALKHPQAQGQTSQTSSYAPTPAASPHASQGPIPSMPYPPAHPSHGSAPVQYPEAAWGSAQTPYESGVLQPGATWQQGYSSNGHVTGSPREYAGDDKGSWDPIQHQHWHTNVHAQHNGYASAAAIPDTPMSPLEERQGYSPHAHLHGPGQNSPYHMQGSVPNGRGPELDKIKRQAQMHLQKSLASHHHQQYGPAGAWPTARHASPLGGGSAAGPLCDMGLANGHLRSNKRGRSAESDPEGGSKRSRLGTSAPALQPGFGNGFEQAQHGQAWIPDDAEGPAGCQADAGVLGVMEMVHQVLSNQVSQEACEAKNQLRSLDAAEGIGVMAWLIDGMLSQRTDPDSHAMIADWVTDLADFAKHRIQMSRT
ncbi:TPA: hypothetical protein ACH3X2_007681 [Trebouxia sp. C0005]